MHRGRSTKDGRQRILDAAVAAVKRNGVSGFRVEDVLLEARASSSSLYHHFGSRALLIRAAMTDIHLQLVLEEDRDILARGMAADTHDEFCQFIEEQLHRAATCPVNRVRRVKRVTMASASLEQGDGAPTAFTWQVMMTSLIADLIDLAKVKGIINPDLDSVAYCVWYQGALLGQLLVEGTMPDIDRWLGVALPAALAPLRLPEPMSTVLP